MKVFINTRKHGYSGGLIVVAAESAFEAHGVMCAQNEGLEHYYQVGDWQELTNVTANVDKPQVLAEDGYSE